MSTVENSQNWSKLGNENLDSKYEKCRNITEEIYKRINITFQIKKLEAGQSDVSENSDHLDSNDLSNETDLFACDKSDISSSDTEKPPTDCIKFININNNNEEKKKPVCKRPRKRFRKRVKKRPQRRAESEGSSDEAPLSRIIETDTRCLKREVSPETCMGVPALIVLTADLKSKEKTTNKKEKSPIKVPIVKIKPLEAINKIIGKKEEDKSSAVHENKLSVVREKSDVELKSCCLCNLTFRGDRGLRRHMSMSHQNVKDGKPAKTTN